VSIILCNKLLCLTETYILYEYEPSVCIIERNYRFCLKKKCIFSNTAVRTSNLTNLLKLVITRHTIWLKNMKYCSTSCALTDNELTLTSRVRYNGKDSYFPEANMDFVLKLCCSSCPKTSPHLSHVKLLKEHCNVS